MRGELDFAQSLIQRVATLKDLPDTVLVEVGKRIIFSEGAQSLVRRFHAAGHKVGVVSGGFQQILDPLAAQLDLDHALANTLGITDAVLDGTVHGQIVDREMKETMLRGWAEEHQIPLRQPLPPATEPTISRWLQRPGWALRSMRSLLCATRQMSA